MNEVGRSRGGFGTKIHALADALGNPIKFILTGGKQADCYRRALSWPGRLQVQSWPIKDTMQAIYF